MVSIEPQLIGLLLKSYDGEQANGRCHGVGRGTFTSGIVYQGDWEHGIMHGKGTLSWPDGVIYEGDVQHNKLTGRGKYTWPDGSQYEGEVLEGLRHGRGVFVTPTKEKYEGEWKGGLREGQGVLWYNDERTVYYKGEWHQGQRHGHGVIVYPSGASYDGMWANNRKDGKGVMVWPATSERYQGEWLDDYQHGFGEHVWVESRPERATVGIEKQMCNIYRGHWNRGQRCGDGAFFYADGSQYSGQWHNNQKHGYGVHVFADGRMYEGEFRDDKIVHTYNITTKSGEIPPFFKLHVQDVVQAGAPGVDDYQREVVAIEKLLLRYQSDLKLLYKEYTLQSPRSKYIFSMRMQQFWRFLYECHIMPQITATEVGSCLRDMHKQQAHLLWVNHVTAATAQREEAASETVADEGAAATVEQPIQLEAHADDIVLDDREDDDDAEIADTPRDKEDKEGVVECVDVKLHDVYEVHQGEGPGIPLSFAAYIDPARPILLREFAELLVRVCARYTQRFFEGQGGLYACMSVLFEHKLKPLAQRTSKPDEFTRTFFSPELQAVLNGTDLALRQAFEELQGSSFISSSTTNPECGAVSLGAILSWVTANGWISPAVPLTAVLQSTHRGKASTMSKPSSAIDPTILFTSCVFLEFTEVLCRLLDSEHWILPRTAAELEAENPECTVPEPQVGEPEQEVLIDGSEEQQNGSGEDPQQQQQLAKAGDAEQPAEEIVQKTLVEKLQIFLEQQLPQRVDMLVK